MQLKRKPLNLMETFACASMQQALVVIAPSHCCLAELPSFFTTIELSLKSPCLLGPSLNPPVPVSSPNLSVAVK
jgi:hypothetical protein